MNKIRLEVNVFVSMVPETKMSQISVRINGVLVATRILFGTWTQKQAEGEWKLNRQMFKLQETEQAKFYIQQI